jgi:hypothetical protein
MKQQQLRRSNCVPQGPQEEFIVPLLSEKILSALDRIDDQLLSWNRDNKSVLDCGCGNQPFKETLESHGFLYESFDISPSDAVQLNYVCALDWPIDQYTSTITKTYSLVLVTEVLEHVYDLRLAFRNIASSTKKGGYVLLTCPFFFPLHEEPYDYCRPTVHLLTKLSRSVGLEISELHKAGDCLDIIGTILGASVPRLKHSNTFVDKLFEKIMRFSFRLMFRLLIRARSRIMISSNEIYMSNVLVLRKP